MNYREEDNLAFGNWLKEQREGLGWGLRELARLVGFNASYMWRVEKGEPPASDKLLEALAEVFSLPREVVYLHAGRIPPKTQLTEPAIMQIGEHLDRSSKPSSSQRIKGMPKYRRYVIQKEALDLLSKYGSRYGRITQPPVPVEMMLERLFDITYEIDDLSQRIGKDAVGREAILVPERRLLIVDTSNLSRNRLRFTIAHEIGHWCLHTDALRREKLHLLGLLPYVSKKLPTGVSEERAEREANVFAASLLMPISLLMPRIRTIRRSIDDSEIGDLADTFAVSSAAMTIRLRSLRLTQTVVGEKSRQRLVRATS